MINSNFLLLLTAYLFITFSILGYGLFFERIYEKKTIGKDLGFTGLLGIFFLILYSYVSHYFIAHSIYHNSIIIIIGLILFIFFYKKIFFKKYLSILLLLLLISFISLLIYKTHDDFHYYHFPYSYYLTQYSALIGIGQFNHGFRTPSSIFYLNSLLFLPIIKYFTFYVSAVLFLVFSNLILLSKLIERFKSKEVDYISYLCLLFFIFINIFFYRIQEHGTDRSAQILILILLIYLISFINFEKNYENNIFKIFVILGLIISLKAFYLLYLSLSIPIIYILHKEKKLFLIYQTLKKPFFWIFLLMLGNVIFVYFINTGCLVYPAKFTCFDNLSWSFNLSELDRMSLHYENWSKAGKTPNFSVENPFEHVKYFNWVPNWIEMYFFTKVSDFIFGLLFVMLLLTFIFFKKKKKILIKNKYNYLITITFLIFLIEWFYNHPALRYGGYCLITVLFFLPFSSLLEKYDNSLQEKKYKFIILICLVFIVFIGRNISRINDEIEKYSYMPLKETYYKVDKMHLRIDYRFKELIQNFSNCNNKQNDCDLNLKPKMKKFFNERYIFIVNK